jgi:general L-amino acid transport system permease protein
MGGAGKMTAIEDDRAARPSRVALYRDARARRIFFQALAVILLLWLGWDLVANARSNLAARGILSGFGFLDRSAGFDVSQSLIRYSATDTYRRLYVVGLMNTLLVAVLGIIFATILGFLIGIARLSQNWLLARLAGGYVELVRNLPLLFQLLFWYLAVLGTLPAPRQSVSLFGVMFLNNRGVVLPRPVFGDGTGLVLLAFGAALLAIWVWRVWVRRHQATTGRTLPILWPSLSILLGLPLVAMLATGFAVSFDMPELRGFNFAGGWRVIPEFVALLVGLTVYTAAFIAETVRGGILAVERSQSEAAFALGLSRQRTLRLIVLPQALRVIVPPLTSHYLNLTKNSSLAVGIGYPDLFAVFAGTALNQTGAQAIEIIGITMATYLALSLATSALMNLYNARLRLVER